MSTMPVVAVVGRPNVGKSTLVNRILRRRAAVVEEKPGVTRDRREFAAEWAGTKFLLVDTGGWEATGEGLAADIRSQAEAAVGSADLVLFVTDTTSSLSDDDQAVARIIQRSEVPHLLVANKADGASADLDLAPLWSLGLGEPRPVSALHGRNVGDLLDEVVAAIPAVGESNEPEIPTLAILGRPNVGKSTLLNRLVGSERVLVSEEPGTTRDPVDAVVTLGENEYRVVDTAGIRRASKVADSTEFYSVTRARTALREADVALLVIDGTEGVSHQEQRLAEEIADAGAGLIIVLNKWDATDQEQKEHTTEDVGDRLAFVSWAPVLRISALSGARLKRLPEAIEAVLESRRIRVPTPELNRKLTAWQQAHPPPARRGRRGRVIYAVQAGTEPPTFVLFVRGGEVGPGYLRFIEGRIRSDYEFLGTPIRLIARRRRRGSERRPL